MRKPRQIKRLYDLSNDDFLSHVADGVNLAMENAHSYLHSADALAGCDPGRAVAHLRSVAEEEAAKVLILIDAVRCPRRADTNEMFSRQLGYFGNHLARGVYAWYACNNPATFEEAREIVDSALQSRYYDGEEGELEYRNWILGDREETLYVDYVEENGECFWVSPKQMDTMTACAHPGPSQVVDLADALVRLGCGMVAGLKIIADIWQPLVISDRLSWFEYKEHNVRAVRSLSNVGLSERAEDYHRRIVIDGWAISTLLPQPSS